MSYDIFDKKVYFTGRMDDSIWCVDLKTGIESPSIFLTIPCFANKTHKAVYFDTFYTYLHDFTTNEIKILFEWNSTIYRTIVNYFSPNDSAILFQRNDWFGVFYIKDSSFYSLPFDASVVSFKWYDDNNIIYIQDDRRQLLKCNVKTSSVDTLLELSSPDYIGDYHMNQKYNLLAYTIFSEDQWSPNLKKVYGHFVNTGVDTLLYYMDRDFPECSVYGWFYWLAWNNPEEKLAFIFNELEFQNAIMGYNIDSGKAKNYSQCVLPNNRQELTWASDDTLIFTDVSQYGLICGYKLNNTVGIKEDPTGVQHIKIPAAYPNPFNGSVNIEVPASVNKISIFDIRGREIKTFDNDELKSKIKWNATDKNNIPLPSSVYFILFKSLKDKSVIQKLMYIK